MIIFCKNCKHKSISGWCYHPANVETTITFDGYKKDYKQMPAEKNEDNNCNGFEPSLTYSIKRFIFKDMED